MYIVSGGKEVPFDRSMLAFPATIPLRPQRKIERLICSLNPRLRSCARKKKVFGGL